MRDEGDVEKARAFFLKTRFRNLDHLLFERYNWMNKYINNNSFIVEIGSGAGFSPLYLKKRPLLTDIMERDWIDKIIDATKMDFEDKSVDIIIASHTIHHMYNPYKFFNECLRVLKENGILLIQEINTSLCMRIMLRCMRHEGWSYDVDVFDPYSVVNDLKDPWSANCAVPMLLFENEHKFEDTFYDHQYFLSIEKNTTCEFLIFPLSGGVIAKTQVPELPVAILNFVHKLDKIFTNIAPNIFALGRRIVVRKKPRTYRRE